MYMQKSALQAAVTSAADINIYNSVRSCRIISTSKLEARNKLCAHPPWSLRQHRASATHQACSEKVDYHGAQHSGACSPPRRRGMHLRRPPCKQMRRQAALLSSWACRSSMRQSGMAARHGACSMHGVCLSAGPWHPQPPCHSQQQMRRCLATRQGCFRTQRPVHSKLHSQQVLCTSKGRTVPQDSMGTRVRTST